MSLHPATDTKVFFSFFFFYFPFFWQRALTGEEEAEILRQYAAHSSLSDEGLMECWRLADVIQYSLMNSLICP